ncbi:hypothetical protein [Thalassovita sp.]|uniref:hypothetical protein n=1 Tax=Thalassovita sp. TaxID=1979401 RepID=UPI0029DE89B3|nr:hypothetical protein [Thalassovita sp.]
MIDAKDFAVMERELDKRLLKKLGLRSGPLKRRLQKALRRAPGRLYRAVDEFEQARGLLEHPKLLRLVDTPRVEAAFHALRDHLDSIDPAQRRKDFWLGFAGSAAFALIVSAALLIGWMVRAGHL